MSQVQCIHICTLYTRCVDEDSSIFDSESWCEVVVLFLSCYLSYVGVFESNKTESAPSTFGRPIDEDVLVLCVDLLFSCVFICFGSSKNQH